jgi:hypothetical protein
MRILILFVLLTSAFSTTGLAQGRSMKDLIGRWEVVDSENSSAGLEVINDNQIFLTYGSDKKPVHSYKADFQKSPAWFDFTIRDSTSEMTIRSLIQFINDDLIQWQLFDSDIRPAHFTQTGGEIVYLRRKR